MRRAALLLLLAAAARATAEEPAPKDAPGAPREAPVPTAPAPPAAPAQDVVDAAVARGVAWLRGEQKRDGSFGQGPGETALALLALRHSGVEGDDDACRRAARRLEHELPDGTVYGAALGAVALLAQDARLHRAKVAELVDDLVAAQCANGQWSYGYRTTARGKSGDNSNTQFALFALAAARVRRLPVPDEPFARCAEFLRATQNTDGGFGYSARERTDSYASMTAGAAMCLALAASAAAGEPFGGAAAREDPAARRALAWLAEHFDAERNTGAAAAFGGRKGRRSDAFWRHYWLWSLERAAAANDTRELGRHDWYARGAEVLLARQGDDGQWRDPERELVATCFALLFFRRSAGRTLTPSGEDLPEITPGGGPRPAAGDDAQPPRTE